MFGYIVVNKPELKCKDFDLYRSFYCGLCRELKEEYGLAGQISLTYDLTFVTILLSGLYEPGTYKGTGKCVIHPLRRQQLRKNAATSYAADMNVILTYYKCMDDWQDDRDAVKRGYAALLEKKFHMLEKRYPAKTRAMEACLKELSRLEKAEEKDLDKMSGIFGQIMAELLAWKQDVWEEGLRRMGFYLGKFIYLLDAYDDVEKDRKDGCYNPFADRWGTDNFEEETRQILMMMMAECCREFEKLPIIKYEDILRNVLYSGVWTQFEAVSRKRREEQDKKHGSI